MTTSYIVPSSPRKRVYARATRENVENAAVEKARREIQRQFPKSQEAENGKDTSATV
jgi:hypothetical protein